MIPQDYTVIDLEMTGLHPKNDAILEVGAAKIRNGEVTDTMDIFVNPGRKITQEITELTGITDEMVKEGLSPAAAFHKTAEFIGDDILVGHNIIFDYSFLKQQAVNEKVPFEKKAVDTLKAARKCMLRPEKKSLECLCDYLDIEREREHRAIYDALATHAPMIHKETGHIDWSKGGQQIIDLMRGMYPGHGAYAVLGEEPLKMFWAEAENKSYPDAAFGEIVEVTKKDFAVKCGDGILRIKEVQARGGKKMAADAYLRGHEMQTGILLG